VTLRLLPLLLGTALLAVPAAAPAADPEEPADLYSVKISLSREDPDLHSVESDADLLEFYLFVDGAPTRGAEFGVEIHGGTLVAYVIDTDKAWVTLPMENPYPGTIAQVKAGQDCFEPPVYFGRLMIAPDTPGGTVETHVIPSVRAGQAAVIHCDQSGSFAVTGYHAAVNAPARAPDHLVSAQKRAPSASDSPDHDHAEHGG